MDDPIRKCFTESRLNGLVLPNCLIKAATFEGKSPGGIPGPDLIRFHQRIGLGGIGMTTLAYCAAEADGRLSEDTLYMHEGIRPELSRLLDSVHATGAKVSGQLVHCGNFTKNRNLSGKRPLGPSSAINRLGLTGYRVGGIGPFGVRKAVPVWLDESLREFEKIGVNGGRRGLIVFLAPADIVSSLGAQVADLGT